MGVRCGVYRKSSRDQSRLVLVYESPDFSDLRGKAGGKERARAVADAREHRRPGEQLFVHSPSRS